MLVSSRTNLQGVGWFDFSIPFCYKFYLRTIRQALGNYFPSFVSDNWKDEKGNTEYERLLINSAQDLYGGGSDTVSERSGLE